MPYFKGDCVDCGSCILRGWAGLARGDALEGAELSATALMVRC